MPLLDEVRNPLLGEARQSPNLLSDLAGLEQYIAESYDARSFIELLQNADDAGASRFFVGRDGNYLCVANDGRCFSQEDFESLCRSAASNKSRTSNIGYRGIGFKSVVSFAERVYMVSGGLEAVFCRTRTKREVPGANRVPLVRIPHQPTNEDRKALENAVNLLTNGYKTVFVFADLVGHAIETEFGAFDATSLLFLRHVRQVTLRTRVETVITLRRETMDRGVSVVELSEAGGTSKWMLQESDGIVLAFGMEKDEPVCLDSRKAVLHAFLPTHEKTGLGIKINGDFSTDPSRTRVVLDERTSESMKRAANLVVNLTDSALGPGATSETTRLLEPLVPVTDPRIAAFQRPSFERDFLTALVQSAHGRLDKYRLRPSWFKSASDFEKLAVSSGLAFVSHRLETCERLVPYLKALGCREATLDEIADALVGSGMSILGTADVVDHLCTLNALGRFPHNGEVNDWLIWPVGEGIQTLAQAKASGMCLNNRFLDLMGEKSGSLAGVKKLLSAIGGSDAANLIPADATSSQSATACDLCNGIDRQTPPEARTRTIMGISLRKWRSAEQLMYDLLKAQGWQVIDVSRQNLGYDLEASKPGEETMYIEVKSIDHPGQSFTLTSNEEVVARVKGVAYRVALVWQSTDFVEIAFIIDPTRNLEMVRQCRQWAWFCESYTYEPERFTLEQEGVLVSNGPA